MKTVRILGLVIAAAFAGTALADPEAAEEPMRPDSGRPAHGHARSLRQDLTQTAAPPPAEMPAHMRMTPEERRQLRRDIHEANRAFVHRERRRYGW